MNDQPALKARLVRYLSLDVLRGLTICLMIIVNTPGDWANIYAPFEHAEWHGFTLTDLVYPTFLFVVGNAMSFSMKKLGTLPQRDFLIKVFKRTLLIFALGYFLNGFPFYKVQEGVVNITGLNTIRIMGVLQRIAICYCLATLLIYYFRRTTVLAVSVLILLGYWAVLWYAGDSGSPYSLEGNVVLKLDLLVFDPSRLYQGFGIPFEPEGLLSNLPAIVNIIAGYFAGNYIRENGNTQGTVLKMIAAGAGAITVAQLWNLVFPINKPLWTSSYTLYAIGLDLVILGVLIFIIEVRSVKRWTYFFEVFGKNPLFIYALSGMIIKVLYRISVSGQPLAGALYRNLYTSWLADKNASLLFAVSYMLLLWTIGLIMDKRRIYIRV